MSESRKKYASQMREDLLDNLKKIAQEDGRQFQAVMEEAAAYYIESRESKKVRPEVMAHYKASVERNKVLGKLLAK